MKIPRKLTALKELYQIKWVVHLQSKIVISGKSVLLSRKKKMNTQMYTCSNMFKVYLSTSNKHGVLYELRILLSACCNKKYALTKGRFRHICSNPNRCSPCNRVNGMFYKALDEILHNSCNSNTEWKEASIHFFTNA